MNQDTQTQTACPDCRGDGWHTPTFSLNVLVNCLTCNPDWRKDPEPVTKAKAEVAK